MEGKAEVIVVGGGLAGLCCALKLKEGGVPFLLVEASDAVGGRVRTDRVEGFLLDRGFQVLLTAYPEAQRVLDYKALELHHFYPGAMVRFGGKFHKVGDPWRHPLEALKGAVSPVGTFGDKMKVGRLRRKTLEGPVEGLFSRPETTTLKALQDMGFSEKMIDRFFRPFLGGVFFNRELEISSRMFEFGFRMFSSGETALPARGTAADPPPAAPPGLHSKPVLLRDEGEQVRIQRIEGWAGDPGPLGYGVHRQIPQGSLKALPVRLGDLGGEDSSRCFVARFSFTCDAPHLTACRTWR